jgi:hypothetical protein
MSKLAGDPGPAKEVRTATQIDPKVGAAGIAGSLSVLIVFGLAQLGVSLPTEVAAAFATVLAFAAGYLKRSE